MQHMDEGLLQAWLDGPRGGLPEADRSAVEEHLAHCRQCRARLQALEDMSDEVTSLLAHAEGAEDDQIPALDTVMARGRKLERSIRRPRWRVATGWAASVVVALGLGWLANEMRRPALEQAGPADRSEAGGTAAAVAEAAPDSEGRAVSGERAEPPTGAMQAVRDETAQLSERVAEIADPQMARAAPAPAGAVVSDAQVAVEAPGRLAVSGRVTDAASGRPLEAAQVFVPATRVAALTDRDGRYSLVLDPIPDSVRDLTLSVQMLGYDGETRALPLTGPDTMRSDFQISATAIALNEIVVTGAAGSSPGEPGASVTILPTEPRAPHITPPVKPGAPPTRLPLDEDSVAWRGVSRREAEAFVGFPVRTVPDLEVVSLQVGMFQETPVGRVVQLLEGSGQLTLFQAGKDLALRPPEEGESATIRLDGGVFITGRASLPADSIRALLARIR